MTWELKGDRPIYLQLMEQVQLRIVSGEYPAGGKLPTVRDMATQASVNPNTMQKALSELERDGLVFSQRTSGRFITEDAAMIQKAKEALATEQVREFFRKMDAIGYGFKETMRLVEDAANNNEGVQHNNGTDSGM